MIDDMSLHELENFDYSSESPKAYYQGYEIGRKAYNDGHSRGYLKVLDLRNPYDSSSKTVNKEFIKHYAYSTGICDGYDYERTNDIKTKL